MSDSSGRKVHGTPPWTWRIPERFNIAEACLDAHVGQGAADRAALIVDDDLHGIQRATFRELAEATRRFARVLRELGIGKGERVLIRLPNSIEQPVAFLGALRAGAIAVPTSMLLTAGEVDFLLRDSGARVVVADQGFVEEVRRGEISLEGVRAVLVVAHDDEAASSRVGLPGAIAGVEVSALAPALAAVPDSAAASEESSTRAEDPAYLVYTSGTTDRPKGVLHAHRSLLGREPSSRYWFDFVGDDRVLHCGKLNWTYTLGTGLMDPLRLGHTVIVHEGSTDPAVWPRLVARHRATILVGVPTIYRQILQRTSATHADVPTLRHCMSAGEPLSADVLAAWRERFGGEIYEGLGMTECSYYVSQSRAWPVRPGSAGYAQPGHEIRILDPETLAARPAGEEGMIGIPLDDPALCLRYWRRPEEDARLRRAGWFLTGDFARIEPDGSVWFVGRRDEIVKSLGYRVSPIEVERVLRELPGVADGAVVGEEVAPGKTLVVAYVVLAAGATMAPDTLRTSLAQRLASYKAPKTIYVVTELPRTRNGKVRRADLHPGLAVARSTSPERAG